MLSLKDKYESKIRRTEKYWQQDARDYFFHKHELPVTVKASLIFCLYDNEHRWTAFFDDAVRYKAGGTIKTLLYADLEKVFDAHFTKEYRQAIENPKADQTDKAYVRGEHVNVWVVNEWIYCTAFNFVQFMTHAINLEKGICN